MNYEASIVIPVYNEVKSLSPLCNKLVKSFKTKNIKYIFIDDGSNDGSLNWLKENLNLLFEKKDLELITLKKNYGKGYAIREGIKKIEGNYTIFLDSDLEYEPMDLLEMYNLIIDNKEIQVLHGSRNLGSKIQLRRYFLNGIVVKINTWIFNFLFNQSLSDLHTGSKIISNEFLKKLTIDTNGFALEIVLSSEIAKRGIKIYEYGVSYCERTFEEGKKITFLDGLKSYYYLFKERFLKNDIQTQISMIFSIIFMVSAGSFFGEGWGKFLSIIFYMIIGLIISLNRKIIPLSLVFIFILVGIFFSKGDGQIYYILIFFIIGLYISKKIDFSFLKIKNSFIKKLLF